MRVRKPSADEVADLPKGAILISHIESCEQDETLKQILAKEVVFLAMERIPPDLQSPGYGCLVLSKQYCRLPCGD